MSLLNHVVVSAVVVGCVLLPRQELFWVEQLVMNMYRQTYIHTGRSNPNTGITLFGSSEHAPHSKQKSTWGQSGLVLIERWLIYRGRQQCSSAIVIWHCGGWPVVYKTQNCNESEFSVLVLCWEMEHCSKWRRCSRSLYFAV